MVNIALLNIVLLGFAFSCSVLSFITIGTAQKRITVSIKKQDPNFRGHAFISLCITYCFFSISTVLTPSFINKVGPRPLLIIASFCQMVYNIQFLFLNEWLLYIASAICGIGSGLSWTAQGIYVTENSTETTITRNSGIFWSIMQTGRLLGYTYLYFLFNNEEISKKERNIFYGSLVGVCILGCIFFACLRKAVYSQPKNAKFCESFIGVFKLLGKRDMILLVFTFGYGGIMNSFYTGVYNNVVGFSQIFDFIDMKLVALSGLLVSVGEILGASIFGIFGHCLVKKGRYPIILFGFILHVLAGLFIILNLPDEASHKVTHKPGIISSLPLALFCSFLLGFGNACFCTQLYGMLASIFSKQVSQAYAVYSFVSGMSAAIAYFYSTLLGLFAIVGIYLVAALISTATFCIVELKPTLTRNEDDRSKDESMNPQERNSEIVK